MRSNSALGWSTIAGVAVLSLVAWMPHQQATSRVAAPWALMSSGWIDATATLDPATTPVYQGNAPLKFEFVMDMRKGDALTLSAYSLGAHSGTHIDGRCISCAMAHRSTGYHSRR